MNQFRETLGQYLKRERELHLVSVQEMALSAGMVESLLKALEEDDLDAFSHRSQAEWLVKHYAVYLDLKQKEVLRCFGSQWKLYNGVKRFPRLSHFMDTEPSPRKPVWTKGKGIPAGGILKVKIMLPLVVVAFVVGFVIFIDLTNLKQNITPSEPLPPLKMEHSTVPHERNAIPPETDAGRTDLSQKKVSAVYSHPDLSVTDRKAVSQTKSAKVIGNSDTKRYHLPGMRYYNLIKAYHRVVFSSEKEAIKAGYRKARK